MSTSRLSSLLAVSGIFACWLGPLAPAHALPSFARQTGDDCTSCHVGGYGPQLTPHGIAFKLGGYTETNGSGSLPFSGMIMGTWTHTAKNQPSGAGPHDGPNNNASLQEVSLFLAGGLTQHLGAFVQGTYSDIDTRKFAMDNMDVRYANNVTLAGKDAVIGVTFNNNPTITDPFGTLPGWRFPYASSELVPGPVASPMIDGGMEQQIGGVSAYGLWDNHVYVELGGYRTLPRSLLRNANVISSGESADFTIHSVAPYGRLAYYQDGHKQAWHVGLVGFAPEVQSASGAGTDKYTDFGIDGGYQFLGTREHIITVNGAYIHETRTLDPSEADNHKGHLNRFDLSSSYYYHQTWGLTAGLFDIAGNRDATLYGADSQNGSPNSRGYVLQADWTPFGKEGSLGAPWANVRLGLQYTDYTKFNGASRNYDGTGRDAKDNNSLFAFVWTAF